MTAEAPALPVRRPPSQRVLTRVVRLSRLSLLLLLVGLAWRAVRYGESFPVWGDEAFVAVNIVERDFAGLARPPLEYTQIVPVGFCWAEEAVSRVLGLSEYALRLLPFLAGVAALLLLWRLARQMLDRHAALLAAAIAAASYYLVRHGAEVKAYTGDCLISLALTSLAWSIHRRGGSLGKWAALTAIGVVGVWMSFPAVFVAAGAGLFLAIQAARRRAWGTLATAATAGALIGASFLAMYLVYAKPMAATASSYWEIRMWEDSFPPTDKPWLIPLWLLRVHAGAMFAHPTGGNNFGSTGTLMAVVFGCVALRRGGRGDALALLLLPFAVSLAAAFLHTYPYGGSARVALHLAPAACLLAGAGFSAALRWLAPRRRAPDAVRWAALGLAAFAVAGIVSDVAAPFKRDSNRQAKQTARKFAAMVAPGDRVLLGMARDIEEDHRPLPRIEGTESQVLRYYFGTLLPTPPRWAPDEPAAEPGRRTWLLFYDAPRLNMPRRVEQFEAYLKRAQAVMGPATRTDFRLKEPHEGFDDMTLRAYLFPAKP
jgi:4-amino-4-deoxy-L-arabinose transferase-like glycosyltransferase